jgi:hypothetical protein
MGIMRLSKRYGTERLESACARALAVRARSYKHVDSILKHGLDRVPLQVDLETALTERPSVEHENIRGRKNYH